MYSCTISATSKGWFSSVALFSLCSAFVLADWQMLAVQKVRDISLDISKNTDLLLSIAIPRILVCHRPEKSMPPPCIAGYAPMQVSCVYYALACLTRWSQVSVTVCAHCPTMSYKINTDLNLIVWIHKDNCERAGIFNGENKNIITCMFRQRLLHRRVSCDM